MYNYFSLYVYIYIYIKSFARFIDHIATIMCYR